MTQGVVSILRRRGSLADLHDLGDYFVLPDKGVVMICPVCGGWMELGGPRCYPHQIISKEPLTVVPSVVCPWKRCHYIVTAGVC